MSGLVGAALVDAEPIVREPPRSLQLSKGKWIGVALSIGGLVPTGSKVPNGLLTEIDPLFVRTPVGVNRRCGLTVFSQACETRDQNERTAV